MHYRFSSCTGSKQWWIVPLRAPDPQVCSAFLLFLLCLTVAWTPFSQLLLVRIKSMTMTWSATTTSTWLHASWRFGWVRLKIQGAWAEDETTALKTCAIQVSIASQLKPSKLCIAANMKACVRIITLSYLLFCYYYCFFLCIHLILSLLYLLFFMLLIFFVILCLLCFLTSACVISFVLYLFKRHHVLFFISLVSLFFFLLSISHY